VFCLNPIEANQSIQFICAAVGVFKTVTCHVYMLLIDSKSGTRFQSLKLQICLFDRLS
jgi:hypothetical protein